MQWNLPSDPKRLGEREWDSGEKPDRLAFEPCLCVLFFQMDLVYYLILLSQSLFFFNDINNSWVIGLQRFEKKVCKIFSQNMKRTQEWKLLYHYCPPSYGWKQINQNYHSLTTYYMSCIYPHLIHVAKAVSLHPFYK